MRVDSLVEMYSFQRRCKMVDVRVPRRLAGMRTAYEYDNADVGA